MNQARHADFAHPHTLFVHIVVDARVVYASVIEVLPDVMEVPVVERIKRRAPVRHARTPVDIFVARIFDDGAPAVGTLRCAKADQERRVTARPLEVFERIIESEPFIAVTHRLCLTWPWRMLNRVCALGTHPEFVLTCLPAYEL